MSQQHLREGTFEQDPATVGDHRVNLRYFLDIPGGDVCIS